jgi:hypothetical protein
MPGIKRAMTKERLPRISYSLCPQVSEYTDGISARTESKPTLTAEEDEMNTISRDAYEGDLVSRLRNWRGLHIAHSGRLYEEAADEIERLRNGALEGRETVSLTAEEREAIAGAMWDYGQYADELGLSVAEATERQATLRGLLDRTKDQERRDINSDNTQGDAEPSLASAGSQIAAGLVAAIIQTDANGKVEGIRHQTEDDFPPNELIPLYLCPQLSISRPERLAIRRAADWLAKAAETRNDIHTAGYLCDDAAVLRGLLDRTK